MIKWILLMCSCIAGASANAQRISVPDLLAFMKGKAITHIEDSLKKRGYTITKTETSLDKSRALYIWSQKKNNTIPRTLELSNFAATAPKGRQITYSTNDATEYDLIVAEFKKKGMPETTKGSMGKGYDYWNFTNNEYHFQLMRKTVKNKDGNSTVSYTIQVMAF